MNCTTRLASDLRSGYAQRCARRIRVVFPNARARNLLGLLAFLALVNGCATSEQTKSALAGYRQAAEEVERTANLFLADFSDGLKVQRDIARAGGISPARTAPREYPAEFVLPRDTKKPSTESEEAVSKTRQALAVVHQYNEALLALAEGQSTESIQRSTQQFGSALESLAKLAGSAIPGIGQFVGVGSKIVAIAQDAQNRAQLERAIVQGHEPVSTILTALENQTPAIYKLSVVGAEQGKDAPFKDIARTGRTMKTFIAGYGPPTDPDISREMSGFQSELQRLGDKTRTKRALPVPLPFSTGRPAFDANALGQMRVFMQAVRASAERYATVVAKQNAYYRMLEKYVATLRQTQQGLNLVKSSLSEPVDLQSEALVLLGTAFELRQAMDEFRYPVTGLSTP